MELFANADMGTSEAREYSEVADLGRKLMRSAMAQLSLSARAFHRI
jgi:magnesium chelatase family protein